MPSHFFAALISHLRIPLRPGAGYYILTCTNKAMPPATSDDQLSTALARYHAGQFGQAAAAFRSIPTAPPASASSSSTNPGEGSTCNTSNSSRKRKIDQCSTDNEGGSANGNRRMMFSALPSLSVEADAALSVARSALLAAQASTRSGSKRSASSDGTNATCHVKAALDANATYRAALLSASMALRRLGLDKKVGSSSNASQDQRQCGVSFLMAGTSASWLHMAIGDGHSARDVLIDSLRSAASCFFDDRSVGSGDVQVLPPPMLPMTNEEAWHLVQSGLLDGNDTNDNKGDANEKERCQIAFHTFCNATLVANLGCGAPSIIPMASSNMTTSMSKTTDDSGVNENSGDGGSMRGSVGLRRQELLIHALTLHRSLKDLGDEASSATKSKERDALLKEAASLEAHLGPARSLQILLDGLTLLSSPNPSEDSTALSRSDVASGLKALASSSRMARAMLGCIYASRGQHALALDAWQKTVELGGEDTGSRAYQATALGMADRFVLLGEATRAVELLKSLNPNSSISTSDRNQSSTPLKISLGNREITNSSKEDLLWRIFFVATLAEDWATSLAAAEKLVEAGNDSLCKDVPCARAALIFSLLQCHRQSDALDKYVEWSDCDVGGSLGALLSLYEADALISVKGDDNDAPKPKIGGKEISAIHEKCRLAIEQQFESEDITDSITGDDNICSDLSLDIATDNNQGISFILQGNTKDALLAFEDASKARPDVDNLLLLRPRFNLSLLLWREGHKSEAAKVWMGTRNLQENNIGPYQGEALHAKMEEAISRHALFCARKRSASGDALGVATDGAKISPWRSGEGQRTDDEEETSHLLGMGMDLEQILAFDIVVLQHAVTEMKRNESRNASGPSSSKSVMGSWLVQ